MRVNGASEAEPLAEAAMEPAKDTRETLHSLYRENLVQLMPMQQGKQHNPASMVFLWSVDHRHLLLSVRDKVCIAMTNLRLRRQHQTELGKAWIERATDQDVDENDHEEDKVRYNKFCQGLERLDHAMMQIDETLLVLYDF
jgi:DNA-directed RNA polymerase III subunit RPC3